MIAGGVRPWASALGYTTVYGTRGDGWLVVGAGAIAGALMLHHGLSSPAGWKPVAAAVLGAAGALATVYELADKSRVHLLVDDVDVAAAVSHAWGLYLS